jgi:Mg2+ and Co2+ transporter CorA
MVRETLAQSLPAAASFTAGTTNTPTTNSALDSIMPDFKRIMPRLEKLETRVERLIDRCTSEMQLSAARESLAESHNLAQLTWLSTIFVPLTFVASLFSTNENIGSLKDTLVIYFASAAPFAIVTLLVARWGVDLARFVRRYCTWSGEGIHED